MENSELLITHFMLGFSSLLVATLGKLVRPESPNGMMGYRTKRSMKSQATWDFANDFGGNMMMWTSIGTVTIQILSYFIFQGEVSLYVTLVALFLGMIISIGSTEYQLAQRFDKAGNPKAKTGDRF